MKKLLKRKLINFIAGELFNSITEDEFLRVVNGKMKVLGQELTTQDRKDLAKQAQLMKETPLWILLVKEMKYIANNKIVLESTVIEDTIAGKLMLWQLDVLEKKIEHLSKLH